MTNLIDSLEKFRIRLNKSGIERTIGLKTDEPIEDALESLSAILIYSVDIAKSLEELKEKLRKFKSMHFV